MQRFAAHKVTVDGREHRATDSARPLLVEIDDNGPLSINTLTEECYATPFISGTLLISTADGCTVSANGKILYQSPSK